MDGTAVESIAELASAALKANRIETPVPAILHDGKIESIEHLTGKRSYFRGVYATNVMSDFVAAVRRDGGQCFIDADHYTATAFHNLGTKEEPGACDWRSRLELKETAPYKALKSFAARTLSQRDAIEFVQDWHAYIQTVQSGESHATTAAALVNALRKLRVTKKQDSTHVEKDYGATKSALEAVEARSDAPLPQGFLFTCQPFEDFRERKVFCRMSVLTGEDSPSLRFRIEAREALDADLIQEFRDALDLGLNDPNVALSVGVFTP